MRNLENFIKTPLDFFVDLLETYMLYLRYLKLKFNKFNASSKKRRRFIYIKYDNEF